jgi:hypothetical protein
MPTDDILAVVGRADELYLRRAEPGAVRESVMILSGVRRATGRYEIQWRLARALFFLGQQGASPESTRQLYSAGIAAGELAARLSPDRVEGHFWVGVNLALFAEVQGGIRGARALRWARAELKRAVAISESYHGGGPLRVLGRLEARSPKILGGNRKRGGELLDRALSIAPANTVSMIYAAELAIERGDRDRARALLQQIVESPIDVEWEFENTRDRQIARSILERLARS